LDQEAELRLAIERQEFVLYYQPIIDLASGAIAAVEALARWQHPEKGLLLPHTFIPLAERTGLILQLGLWLLEQSCREATRWRGLCGRDRTPLLNVNLSAHQLQQANIVDRIAEALGRTGFQARDLQLEITESAMILDAQGAAQTLRGLKDLGVRLAIDDFGAGYSSLSYLHSFEVDTLKVDQSFISAMGPGDGSWRIVQAIIGLAHALGMTAIAEGIETAKQLEQVKATGCDLGQGYYFYHPMPASEFEALLRAGKRRD
jgi:EAL domain-containing protein (putative c-di-GMP-specific phosphodiesterase class I)